MHVEAGVSEWTLASSLIEVLAGFRAHRLLVLADQQILIVLRLDPELRGNDEVRGDTALGTRADRPVVELFRHSPLADAVQAKDMSTLFQDTEPPGGRWIFLHYGVHADAAVLIHAALDRKRKFHLLLVFLQTLLSKRRGNNMRIGVEVRLIVPPGDRGAASH